MVESDNLKSLAFGQWTRDLPFTADRGDITDVNGQILASSVTLYTMYCRPSDVENAEETADFISDVLDIDRTLLLTRLKGKGVSETRLCRKVTREEKLTIESRDFLESTLPPTAQGITITATFSPSFWDLQT